MKFMKIIISILAVLVLGFIILTLAVVPTIQRVVAEEVVLGAHRGAHSIPPENFTENTLESFEKAVLEDNYKFIEFDVQYTKDKVLIVHHDKSLVRLQQKPYNLKDLSYEELLEVSNYHIPTYEETMDIAAGKKPLNIEIKSQGNLEDDKKIADYIIADCIERGILDSTLISSISSDVIVYIKNNYPVVKTGKIYYIVESTFLNFDYVTSDLYEEIKRTNSDYILLHGCNLRNYDSLKRLLPEDKTLVIWYFSDEMYIVQPKTESWVFKLRSFGEIKDKIISTPGAQGELSKKSFGSFASTTEEGCGWWC